MGGKKREYRNWELRKGSRDKSKIMGGKKREYRNWELRKKKV
jgi:hypothetical protein